MGELCRLCALEKDNLVGIYDDEGHRLCIETKIKKCLNIELHEKRSLPKRVCLECCTKLDAFDEFLENSLNAQNTLCMLFPDEKNEMNTTGLEGEYKDLDLEVDEYDRNEREDLIVPENILENKFNNSDEFEELILDKENKSKLKCYPRNNNPPEKQCENEPVSDSELDNNVYKTTEWDPHIWLCSDCSEEFDSVEDLQLHHKNEHKQEPRFMCPECSKQFVIYNGFISHMKRHKNGLKYNCEECGRGFSNKKFLDSHRSTHSDSRPFVCQECGKAFRQQSALFIHSRCHLPEDIKNKFQCDQCNKRFSTKPNLVTHKRIHTGIRNFTCDQCGKSFIQKGNLDAHLLTHSHDKPFSCELCSKKFKTGLQLRKHHSVHTGAKPHQCDVCGRTFREKGTLREHHRIHTGAMPFTCEYCGKAFRFKGILTTHRRQHTGERPYSCLECQHHFTNWPNYNKHMKRRHGINTSRTSRKGGVEGGGVVGGTLQPTTQALFAPLSDPLSHHQDDFSPSPHLQTYIPYSVYSLPTTIDHTATLEIMQRVLDNPG